MLNKMDRMVHSWDGPEGKAGFSGASLFVGVSDWARKIRAAIISHARHIRPLAITGEHGSGKKHVAEMVHLASARRNKPFITLDCAALSEDSLEASIFGEIRRMGDGPPRILKGSIALAQGGTLYLQDFWRASKTVHEKLSRFLVMDTYRLVGSNAEEQADVRLIFGITRNPPSKDPLTLTSEEFSMVGDRIDLIPLRERSEDIIPIALHFLREFCEREGRELRIFSSEAETALAQYHWPGNVAELARAVEHIVSRMAPSEISVEALLQSMKIVVPPSTSLRLGDTLELSALLKSTERQIICEALRVSGGRQNKAAQLLGLRKSTLSTKLSRLGIDPKEFVAHGAKPGTTSRLPKHEGGDRSG